MEIKILKVKEKGLGVSIDWIVEGKTPEGTTHRTHFNTTNKEEIMNTLKETAKIKFPEIKPEKKELDNLKKMENQKITV